MLHKQNLAASRAIGKMAEFSRKYPLDTSEMDNAIESAADYRALRDRLVTDDLPRFENEFKIYLNTNTIRDIAGFNTELHKQAEIIKERIETINESLTGIDYNPGRYIRLEGHRTPNTDIRDFQTELRCTDDTLSSDDSELDYPA